MGGYVTPNEATSEISFSASSDSYIYHETLEFTITTNGTRYVSDDDLGVYLAVQVSFSPSSDPSDGDRTGANGEAMGAFHDISDDLVSNTNCASTVYSRDDGNFSAFSGTSTLQWTPSYHYFEDGVLATTGDATFSLVWANDPAGTGVADPYVYMKSLTITNGNVAHSASNEKKPAVQTQASGCASNASVIAGVKHAFKSSPVFVQELTNGQGQTFAAQKCILCRDDAACASARITCGTEPGIPVIEEMWFSSSSCAGEADSKRFVDDVACPGPEHWHVDSLDLDRFVPKLRKDHPEYFKDNATAEEAIREYRRMLSLVQAEPTAAIVPSKLVDLVWHSHILDTATYARDSRRLFGHYLHHAPSFGGDEEKAEMVNMQENMFRRYKERYGAEAKDSLAWQLPETNRPTDYPDSDVWAAQESPDCCAAMCVKPACQSCVGCNAIDCGFMGEADNSQRPYEMAPVPLAPERFAGYVPSNSARPFHESGMTATYACISQPHKNMILSWSVIDDHIYFKHESAVMAWYGVGLGSTSTDNMGGGVDYMITMPAGGNYTDYVRDMYKWDDGNGYPCWDVLYECSAANGTIGTPDLEDVSVDRIDGYTTSTWNRALVNDDEKDYDISNDFVRVLFAYGVEDYFTYHGANFGECITNLISGVTEYCWWA